MLVISTSPYTESWKEPESVMIRPSNPSSRWSPSESARSLKSSLREKM
ncbi:MAG: hypothetical protein A4E40_00717 [Methanoregulaceae archaeon PtaU1.Bin059]|nr:MAG: hypothetical protein A4E40_00717 [Methanoregulaceae archaeon PtaU1.Bin059]